MPYRNTTLRRLRPTTRKLARLINELQSTTTRLKHLLDEVADCEFDATALRNAKAKGILNNIPILTPVKLPK